MNSQDLMTCLKCLKSEFFVENKNLVCKICKTVIAKLKSGSGTLDNKSIHLRNVLKNYNNVNVEFMDKIFNLLLETIKNEKIDKSFICMNYISQFLKKYNNTDYVISTRLFNRYYEKQFNLTDRIKTDIETVFRGYVSYVQKYHSKSGHSTSLSYPTILHNIIKTLNIDISLELPVTKNENEHLKKSYNSFLNYLCKKNRERNKKKNIIYCFPNIEDTEKSIYDGNLLN